MDGLAAWLKELTVFVVICETLLSFTPNRMYKRYIKPFVGLILLLRISSFLFGTIEVDWNKRIEEVFAGYEESVSRYLENVPVVQTEKDNDGSHSMFPDNFIEYDDEKSKQNLINIDKIAISPIEIGGKDER